MLDKWAFGMSKIDSAVRRLVSVLFFCFLSLFSSRLPHIYLCFESVSPLIPWIVVAVTLVRLGGEFRGLVESMGPGAVLLPLCPPPT